MADEEEVVNPTLSDDTQEDTTQTDLQDNAEHSEEQDNVEESTDETVSEVPPKKEHTDETMTPEELRRLKNKVSMQDRKLAELERKAQVRPVAIKSLSAEDGKNLDSIFRGQPELYENWRSKWVQEGGQDYGSYNQIYGGGQVSNPQQQNYQQNGAQQNPQNTFEAFESYSAQKNFLKAHPEYDYRKATDSIDGEKKYIDFTLILDTARKLQARATYLGEPLTEEEAYENANLVLNPKQALASAKENGRILGKQGQLLKNTGATPGLSSGAGKVNSDVTLNDEDREVMKRLHLSEDDMKAQKRKA